MEDVRLDDIREDLIELVDFMGMDMFVEFCEKFGGCHFYIPNKKSIARMSRNRAIKKKYNGTNAKELSREFGISENHLRCIIKSY